jgi:hypothetical protein
VILTAVIPFWMTGYPKVILGRLPRGCPETTDSVEKLGPIFLE